MVSALQGFEQAVQLAGEAKNPKRDLSKPIIVAMTIGALLWYILLQVVFIVGVDPTHVAKDWSSPLGTDPSDYGAWVNEPGRVFVARAGRSELTPTVLAPGAVENLVERMLAGSGRRVDISSPFVDAALPDGSRLHVVIPDVTRRHWAENKDQLISTPAT